MDERLKGSWDWWFWHRKLTGELLDALDDSHLGFRPGDGLPTLGRLFADMADTQIAYIESLDTRTLDFGAPEPSAPQATVEDIRTQFGDLDRQLSESLSDIQGDDVSTIRIRREDEQIPLFILMASLIESLLIFHGKVSVYVQLAGGDLPDSWKRYLV